MASSSAPTPYTASPPRLARTWLYMDRHDSAGGNAEPLATPAPTRSVRHIFVIEPALTRTGSASRRTASSCWITTGPSSTPPGAAPRHPPVRYPGDPLIAGRPAERASANSASSSRQHSVTILDTWRWFSGATPDVVVRHRRRAGGLTADPPLHPHPTEGLLAYRLPPPTSSSLLGRERDSILLAPTWDPEVSRAGERPRHDRTPQRSTGPGSGWPPA